MGQFMPGTAAGMHIDPMNPTQAIPGAARYLRGQYDAAGKLSPPSDADRWALALASYNWGGGNVASLVNRLGRSDWATLRARMPAETRNYVEKILGGS